MKKTTKADHRSALDKAEARFKRLSDQRLIRILFRGGCRITSKGFAVPLPGSREAAEIGEAWMVLTGRKSGQARLKSLQRKFEQKKVDYQGRKLSSRTRRTCAQETPEIGRAWAGRSGQTQLRALCLHERRPWPERRPVR